MPQVTISVHKRFLRLGLFHREKRRQEIRNLAAAIQECVAKALDTGTKEGHLEPSQIEVSFKTYGPHDIGGFDFGVNIIAKSYPERLANLDERRTRIEKSLKKHPSVPICPTDGMSGFVWIHPGESSYGEF